MPQKAHEAAACLLQKDPVILLAVLPGSWLLEHTTPSWRIKDPHKGFQRIVKEERARRIASSVLDQKRAFPNAIILATDSISYPFSEGKLRLPATAKFLVVDGQHRLWAQNYSRFVAPYACVLHLGLEERSMAKLFLEINDTQRRVPSSLRWDLVRLVKPEGQEVEQMTADLIYELGTSEERGERGPLYQRIDLTGEQPEIKLKQGSLAPEIKKLLQRHRALDADFEDFLALFVAFFSALRAIDPDQWRSSESVFYKARVIRALVRVLSDLVATTTPMSSLTAKALYERLGVIDTATLSREELVTKQGAAGVTQIYRELHAQVFQT